MKASGYTITKLSETRCRASRGVRHIFLTLIDGQWRQTTKDGLRPVKRIPPRDLERVVAAIEGEE